MEKRYIPQFLDAQIQLLWWELDEIIILMMFVSIGLLTDHAYIASVLGFMSMNLYSKISSKKQPGYFKHVMYKYGLWERDAVPKYWIKELVR